jgi:polyhydroxyalkanoate synthase
MASVPAKPDQSSKSFSEPFYQAWPAELRRYLEGTQVVRAAFDLPVGLTPRELVWSLNKARLYRYYPTQPLSKPRYRVPLLLVYALINKPYIFDLRPGRSFIEFMVNQGFDLYLLDWGTPGLEDRHIRFDDYATDYLPRAVRKLQRISGTAEFSMLGYCIGATLTTLYAALFPQAPLRNLILLTAPLDFSRREDNIFAMWLDERFVDVDKMVDSLGNIPAELIELGAKLMKPVENLIGAYTHVLDNLDDPEAIENWQAMHKWIHDGVPMAGETFRQWVKEYIRANELITGVHVVRGQRVNLANIRASLLNIAAKYDHLVPLSHTTSIMDLVSSPDKRMEILPAGHVGLMGGRNAKYKLWPLVAEWLAARSG